MRTVYFYSVIAGFMAGIFIALIGVPAFPLAALGLITAAGLIMIRWLLNSSRSLIVLVLIILAVCGGLIRAGLDINEKNETVFDSSLNERVVASGVVTTVPEITNSGQNVTVEISEVSQGDGGVTRGVSKAVVYARSFPELHYGDRISLTGELREPSRFETDTGRMFNYPRYLARQEVFYEMSRPVIEIVGEGESNFLKETLTSLRRELLAAIHRHVPDPHAALTGGVLLGAEDALGEDLQQAFRDTGLIHIVVLSGYNVTVVAVAIAATLLFSGVSIGVASVLAGIGVALFALLVGLTPTVVRASIMAIIALIARVFSRQYAASRGLALAAVIMVGVNPHILLFDPSFQLSAVATAGLITFGDDISSWLTFIPERLGLREAATATIAAQLAVLPLLAFYTGTVSIISLLANILVLPVVPLLMAVGTLTALSALLFEYLTLPFAAGSYLVSEYIFDVVKNLSELSFATADIGSISVVFMVLFYAVMVVFTWLWRSN